MNEQAKPVVLITGAAGSIGSALTARLSDRYRVVGLDLAGKEADCPLIEIDLTDPGSCEAALEEFRDRYGKRIAAVLHLAAYFDFTGEESPLYEKVNVEGTRNLLGALQPFEVERFIYSGTMLVHRAGKPGERVDEDWPIEPRWAYPKSKAETERVIRAERGDIPVLILRLAGLYDERTAVPTLSHQIARIYERSFKSHAYAGNLNAGQSLIHLDDMMRLFDAAIGRRAELPEEIAILAGEEDAVAYDTLQDRIGRLIHGEEEWETLSLPKPLAKAGAAAQEAAEPVIPDQIDKGEKPFIRSFMIDMADDHYALDISRARRLLDWEPRHSILETLPNMIAALKDDPVGWYRANGITVRPELDAAARRTEDPDALFERHDARVQREHAANRWAHFASIGLGTWLVTAPPILGYESAWLAWSDVLSGLAVMVLGFLSLSWRTTPARFATAGIGVWLLLAPLIFWAPTAAAYLNDTLVGTLVIGFAILTKPHPGVAPSAAETGPDIPPGWGFNPSAWLQRAPVILLAFVGLYVSRYLAAYQLGHIDGVWDPFFAGQPADGKNGTEEIITSRVSEAWPVPDAGLGALTYVLEIVAGLMGSTARWRTMPWLTLLFGIMIVPLGAVSITFIIIQPIVIGTWCTLCLLAAAAMIVQIPYSLDELVATSEYLWRVRRQGRPWLRVLLRGGTDEGDAREARDEFDDRPVPILKDMWTGGVNLPWTLVVVLLVGVWLMFTRLTLGTEGRMADADHLIGALAITITVTAAAEVGRAIRFLNIPLGMALVIVAFTYGGGWLQMANGLVCGLALMVLSVPRGRVTQRYGLSERFIV